jgi:hypothetical protein
MRIGLEDIDPAIAHAVAERLTAPVGEFLKDNVYWGGLAAFRFQWKANEGKMKMTRKREATEIEKRAFELRKKREEQVGIRAAIASMVPLFAGGGIFAVGMGAQSVPLALTAIGTWIGGTVAGVAWTARATPKYTLRKTFLYDEMRAVFPLLTLTRAERIYCDALQLMARTDADEATEKSLRAMLPQLNQLLENHRQVDARKQALLSVMGLNNSGELEAEYGALGRRLDQTQDPVARQALQQSLQACAARLENAKTLTQNLERLNVQQEAINQTLSSALSAMARMQVAPQVQASLVAEEITTSVTQMNQQTYAVEQAVEEVVRLGH